MQGLPAALADAAMIRLPRTQPHLSETSRMPIVPTERLFRRALIVVALGGLVLGLLAWAMGRGELANWIWAGEIDHAALR